MNLVLVVGARPQIIKSAPFIHLATKDSEINFVLIHTGQHYDYQMTRIFFEELDLPDPKTNLNVGSGTHAQQTAKIMMRLEKALRKQKVDLVIVPGDTNSTLASAITAAKLHMPIAHLEAGARSYDNKMPEEINRRLTDHCSTLLFTPTSNCTNNLLKEGISKSQITQIGDTMYDVVLQQLPEAEKTKILQQLDLQTQSYAILTIHRPENVDDVRNLMGIIEAVSDLKPLKVVFPVHPRTKRKITAKKMLAKMQHMKLIEPQGYHEMLKLIKNAKLVLTDSGGMQKEAFWLRTPCVTLRENTEWPETVQTGGNHLTGASVQKIVETARTILGGNGQKRESERFVNPFGDGKASQRLLETAKSFLTK